MKHPLVPTETVELDRPRVLRFDFNTLCLIEKAIGQNVLQLLIDLQETFRDIAESEARRALGEKVPVKIPVTITQLRAIIWACLVSDEPDLTPEQVGGMVGPGNFMSLVDVLGRLVQGSFPEGKEGGSPLPGSAPAA